MLNFGEKQFSSYLCSLNTELSKTIFSNNSINSFGRSAVMKAFTVTETSSGSCVSDKAVWTTWIWRQEGLSLSQIRFLLTYFSEHQSKVSELPSSAKKELLLKWIWLLKKKITFSECTGMHSANVLEAHHPIEQSNILLNFLTMRFWTNTWHSNS